MKLVHLLTPFVCSVSLLAQTSVPPPKPAEDAPLPVIELSPFQVDATRDEGYSVARDPSGSRLNSDLKDVSASITVFTKDFMQDLGAYDLNTVLDYAPNVSYSEQGANFTPDQEMAPNRARGLDRMAITQDFFPIFDNLDAYKLDRIGFGHGPNSLLFGIGSPGGTITSTAKRAHFKPSYEAELRFDNWGSARGMIDLNRPIIPKRLALRLAAVTQNQEGAIEKTYKRDTRVFLAATAHLNNRPGFRSTVRGNFEVIDGKTVIGNGGLPRDGVTAWLAAGSPTSSVVGAGGSAATRPPGTVNLSSGDRLTVINDPARPNQPILNWTRMLGTNGAGPVIFDEAIYPYDRNIKGAQNPAPVYISQWSAFFEQQLGRDLFVELSAFRGERDFSWPYQVGGVSLQADPNERLPDGSPNPYVGRYYVDVPLRSIDTFFKNDVYRATASYRLDPTKWLPSWSRWLGTHQLLGLRERQDQDTANNRYQWVNVTPLPGFPSDLENARNFINLRAYLDPANGVWDWNPGSLEKEYTSNGVTARRMPIGGQDHRLNRFDSTAFASQSYFFNKRLVITYGWRRDVISNFAGFGEKDPVTGLRPLGTTVDPVFARSGVLYPKSRGAVLHVFDWLSFSYNKSNNFSGLSAAVLDTYLSPLPATSGEGTDYGVRMRLWRDKLSLNLTRYETAQANARAGVNTERDWNQMWEAMGLPENQTSPWPNTNDTFNRTAKGTEATLVFNPLAQWRIYASASRGVASRTDVFPRATAYIQQHLPAWRAVPPTTTIADGRTFQAAIADMIKRNEQDRAQEGAQEYNLRKWNGSLVTNYRFLRGRLAGVGVGASLLYRGDAVVGYPVVDGSPVVSSPYVEPGYTTLNAHISYTRRLRREMTWRTQLSFNNLGDYDGRLLITSRNADGSPNNNSVRWQTGTTVALTTGLKF